MRTGNWTNATWNQWHQTIQHEAAHVAATIHVRGCVHWVRVRSPHSRHYAQGGVLSDEPNSWATAFAAMVGDAWEKTHGAGWGGEADRVSGAHGAEVSGATLDELDRYARAFVMHQADNIRALAKRIASDLPKHGQLKSYRLRRICDEYRQIIPQAPEDILRVCGSGTRRDPGPIAVYENGAVRALPRPPRAENFDLHSFSWGDMAAEWLEGVDRRALQLSGMDPLADLLAGLDELRASTDSRNWAAA